MGENISLPAPFPRVNVFLCFQEHFVTTEAHKVTQILYTLLFALNNRAWRQFHTSTCRSGLSILIAADYSFMQKFTIYLTHLLIDVWTSSILAMTNYTGNDIVQKYLCASVNMSAGIILRSKYSSWWDICIYKFC